MTFEKFILTIIHTLEVAWRFVPIEHGESHGQVLVERNSRKLIRMLEQDGWVLDRVNGDHHTFKHPAKEKIITVTHPRRDLPVGIVRRIYKLAGWRP